MKNKKIYSTLLSFLCYAFLHAQVQVDKQLQMTGSGADAQITGIKTVTNAQDATSVESIQKGGFIYAAASGSSNNFTISISPAISSYQAGMTFNFISNQAITGAATLNVNGLGAVSITKLVNQPMSSCDIQSGQLVTVVYDGTNFQITSLLSGTPAAPVVSSNSPVCAGSVLNLTATSNIVGASYSWSGPNGFTSGLQNPVISNFQSGDAGTYTVTITANGCSSSAATTTALAPSASSAFTYSPSNVYVNTPVTFNPSVGGATYSWTFPSGSPSSSSSQNPSVTWTTGGSFNVDLTVTVGSCNTTTTNAVSVIDPSSPTLVCQAGDNITAGNTVGYKGCVTFTYNGNTVTYTTVRAADGKEWLQQNLGATQIATSATDANAYGDLFQWGRWDDGHQTRSPNNVTNSNPSPNNAAGVSFSGPNPFYWRSSAPYWWDGGGSGDTWSGTTPGDKSSTNGIDPCKQDLGNGWHMPTSSGDWTTVFSAENITNATTGYSSNLKLTMPGYRNGLNGTLSNAGVFGNYWGSEPSSNPASGTASYVDASSAAIGYGGPARVHGVSIRCVK